MDRVAYYQREVQALHAAARAAAADGGGAPAVPSCPGWSMSDLLVHLGSGHRGVAAIIRDRRSAPPEIGDLSIAQLPADLTGWPPPDQAPNFGPIPDSLLTWFAEGAAALGALFAERPPGEPVWTWSAEQTVGFWLRMQTIEAAVHRWDAENAIGTATPIPDEVAADAVAQTFEVMAPARRTWMNAPAGSGERYRFRRTDGPGLWTVRFDGDDVRLSSNADSGGSDVRPSSDGGGVRPSSDGGFDVEVAGTASDLMLFLWQRIPADDLDVRGDKELLNRYFVLVPPV